MPAEQLTPFQLLVYHLVHQLEVDLQYEVEDHGEVLGMLVVDQLENHQHDGTPELTVTLEDGTRARITIEKL